MTRLPRTPVTAVALLMLALGLVPASADISIRVDEPIISSVDRNFGSYLDKQLVQAFAAAEADLTEIRGESVVIARGRPRSPAFSLSVIVTDTPDYSAIILNMTNLRTGRTSEPFNYAGSWTDNLHRTVRRAVVYLYSGLTDRPAASGEEPVLLASMNMNAASSSELGFDAPLSPYGLATDSHGDLLVAANATVVRFDRHLREIGKLRPPSGANQYSWAGKIAVSPSDMVYCQSITGGDLWVYSPDIALPGRVRTGSQSTGYLAVMEDGSVILHDAVNQGTTRIRNNERIPLTLTKGPYSYIFALAGGPENTVWTWDLTSRMATISDPAGYEIDVVIPQLSAQEGAMVRALAAYPNGDLLLGTPNTLYRFTNSGMQVWSFSLADHPEIGSGVNLYAMAFDKTTGIIYVVQDALAGTIYQILDVDYSRSIGAVDDGLERLIDVSKRIVADPRDGDAYAERATIHESDGAWLAAHKAWDDAVYSGPSSQDAEEGIARAELQINLSAARATAAWAREVLASIGRASAQDPYFRSLAAYEQILATNPGNREITSEMNALIDEFDQSVRPREINPFPLNVTSVHVDDVFPALSLYYSSNPIGSVTVRNDLDVPVTNIRAKLEMSVMDFPTTSEPVANLEPGQSATLNVLARLSERALSLRGRLLVQPQITVEYTVDGKRLSVSEVTEISAHSNKAITWDDSRKLASFIMPDEQIAGDFASRYADIGAQAGAIDLSSRLFRAMRIADFVGALGITYVEDPGFGITEILGEASVIDTVRYPRDTLRVQAGDCDDTTALLCTLYEATGIATAIMTSPGHVFMAFDTGEPVQNAWMFESDQTAIVRHEGSVWLPVETTILDEGFNAAWTEGSRLLSRYEPEGKIEFLPVADARSVYEPIPTGPAGYDISDLDDPIAAGGDELYSASLDATVDALYSQNVAALERDLRSQSAGQRLRTLNQVGVLHARFNETAKAEQSFREAIGLNPDYTASYINLANLRIIQDEPADAIALLDEVRERRPNSVLANLLLAQANQMLGNREEANQFMVIVEEQAPELAAQYPQLTGASVGRASEAHARPILPWPDEE